MKILVIGSGGREHALVWRLSQSGHEVVAAPGNPGIAQLAECKVASSPAEFLRVADAVEPDFTVVGPEAPLVAGIVDLFRENGRPIVGPTAAAAQLEGSKAFSKAFMGRAGIPTARYEIATSETEAWEAIRSFGYPVVLKADGLAAGKGVVIAHDEDEAKTAIPHPFAKKLVVEEFLQGDEVSFIVLSDGLRALPLQPTQDHKAVFDGDRGPNTGGMGAYCDSRILTFMESVLIVETVIEPAIRTMAAEGTPFTGFLYAGLMMTADGPKVLEFNVRLGDPEAQALMHRLDSDFAPALLRAAQGDLSDTELSWKPGPSVCVVVAAEGYPGHVRSGDEVKGIEKAEQTGAVVFHAGTKKLNERLVTASGRVLGVTAGGDDLKEAVANAYRAVEAIEFNGLHYRKDIGARGLR